VPGKFPDHMLSPDHMIPDWLLSYCLIISFTRTWQLSCYTLAILYSCIIRAWSFYYSCITRSCFFCYDTPVTPRKFI